MLEYFFKNLETIAVNYDKFLFFPLLTQNKIKAEIFLLTLRVKSIDC